MHGGPGDDGGRRGAARLRAAVRRHGGGALAARGRAGAWQVQLRRVRHGLHHRGQRIPGARAPSGTRPGLHDRAKIVSQRLRCVCSAADRRQGARFGCPCAEKPVMKSAQLKSWQRGLCLLVTERRSGSRRGASGRPRRSPGTRGTRGACRAAPRAAPPQPWPRASARPRWAATQARGPSAGWHTLRYAYGPIPADPRIEGLQNMALARVPMHLRACDLLPPAHAPSPANVHRRLGCSPSAAGSPRAAPHAPPVVAGPALKLLLEPVQRLAGRPAGQGGGRGRRGAAHAGACRADLGSRRRRAGGSIRQPAHFCGVVGIKPTYGRVSRSGLVAYGSSLDCVGPLATCVEDAALLLTAISGARGGI